MEMELEDALRVRLDPEVEFPTDRVARSMESLARGTRCVGASAPVETGQVRLLSGHRLFVLVVDSVGDDDWLCMPIHHYRRLQGPGDVEIARDCYVEAWQSIVVPTSMLAAYGMKVPVVSRKSLGEVLAAMPKDSIHVGSKGVSGVLALFRAAEIQYVMMSNFSTFKQEQSFKGDTNTPRA